MTEFTLPLSPFSDSHTSQQEAQRAPPHTTLALSAPSTLANTQHTSAQHAPALPSPARPGPAWPTLHSPHTSVPRRLLALRNMLCPTVRPASDEGMASAVSDVDVSTGGIGSVWQNHHRRPIQPGRGGGEGDLTG